MATEGNTRPDEPLRQYPEEKSAPSQVGTHERVPGDESTPATAVDTYSVPGAAQPDPEAAKAVEEFENEPRADTDVDGRVTRASLVADTRSPEVNYLTRDNIVFPDPRPEEAARVERFAKATLLGNEGVDGLTVTQDATDVHEQLLREGRRDSDVPALEQGQNVRDEAIDQRSDVDAQSDNVVGPV